MSSRPRVARTGGRSSTTGLAAAGLALILGTAGTASTAAHAAEPAIPAPPAVVSTPAAEHPELTVTVRAELVLEPDRPVTVGTPIRITSVLANTGDVPLTVSLAEFGRQDARIKPEGEYRLVDEHRTVTADDLEAGWIRDSGEFTATTPSGATLTSPPVDCKLLLRAPADERHEL
ncbi:hypothetical protein EDF35_0955 [Rathayibacter sp. PhB151]|jgi:hypothetical protein|uniref:hypothetical protein n=1 Tax=Rathayibacter sp. PhB151 TaxID=2485189 RepID=UPI001062B90A|nr:hypothetical protein [Rathayibacter sp. PhB151]TDX81289.1 hypothetical protein EDF35_0955 [Rathayibacter sp. PhB151]